MGIESSATPELSPIDKGNEFDSQSVSDLPETGNSDKDDDLLSELEGEELRNSLKLHIEGEIKVLEQLEDNKPTAYDTITRGINANQW